MSATTAQIGQAIRNAGLTVHDNGVPKGASIPYTALWGGVPTPDGRALSGTARQSSGLWQVVCVSNTLTGVRLIAAAVIDAMDGHRIGGTMTRTPFTSSPQKDTSDPSATVWTVTIDITQKG